MPESCVEVSFEVANKVGGIYQVLKSKACRMQDFYGDEYITIGFFDEENAATDFAPRETPEELEEAFDSVREKGVEVHYGVWRISSSPRCILLDTSGSEIDPDAVKKELWEIKGVDSMTAGPEFEDSVVWSRAAGILAESLRENLEGETVVHAHEWLSGPALFEVDSATVFTTHATVLGRALSNSDYRLQEAVDSGSVEADPFEYGVGSKHQLERAAAEYSDAFTTVSEITAKEAKAVLGMEVDKVLPNGFNVEEFPALEDLSYQHRNNKDEMKEFLSAYFQPYYDVDLENDPRILYTSGRYEFHNKGYDVFIDALAELNEKEGEDIFVFFFVPSDNSGPNSEVLENMSLYQELEDYVSDALPEMEKQLLNALTSGVDPGESICRVIETSSQEVETIQRNFHDRDDSAPLCAFNLTYPEDSILESMWNRGLRNREEDRVKVVFYPTYLSRGDRLLSMGYEDAIKASSAGIFPSYYEPWGYTPVETAANGALAVTTDMAGFGKWLLESTSPEDRKGIRVLRRKNCTDAEASEKLADILEEIASYSKTEITERKHNARKLAQLTSWNELGENYRDAHRMAVENAA